MFLDHYKPAYTTDLKLCEELRLVTKGSVMAADNVIKPGNPPYLEYVRSSVEEKRKAAGKADGESGPDSRFAERSAKQYAKRQGEEKLAPSRGNPNLVYDSKLVNSFEPTGVPVSAKRSQCSQSVTDYYAGWCRDYEVCQRRPIGIGQKTGSGFGCWSGFGARYQ